MSATLIITNTNITFGNVEYDLTLAENQDLKYLSSITAVSYIWSDLSWNERIGYLTGAKPTEETLAEYTQGESSTMAQEAAFEEFGKQILIEYLLKRNNPCIIGEGISLDCVPWVSAMEGGNPTAAYAAAIKALNPWLALLKDHIKKRNSEFAATPPDLEGWWEKGDPFLKESNWIVPLKFGINDERLSGFKTAEGLLKIQGGGGLLASSGPGQESEFISTSKEEALNILVTFLNKQLPGLEDLQILLLSVRPPLGAGEFHVDESPNPDLYLKFSFNKEAIESLEDKNTDADGEVADTQYPGNSIQLDQQEWGTYINTFIEILELFKEKVLCNKNSVVVTGFDFDFEIEQIRKVLPTLRSFINLTPNKAAIFDLIEGGGATTGAWDIGLIETGDLKSLDIQYKLIFGGTVVAGTETDAGGFEATGFGIQMPIIASRSVKTVSLWAGAAHDFAGNPIPSLSISPPFDSKRTCRFIVNLKKIVDRYKPLLTSTESERDISSFIQFVEQYISNEDLPPVDITQNITTSNEEASATALSTCDLPGVNDLYVPVQTAVEATAASTTEAVLEIKEEIAAAVDKSTEIVMDPKLQNALDSIQNIVTLDDVYTIVLNEICFSSLTDIALGVLTECVSQEESNQVFCEDRLVSIESTKRGYVQDVLIPELLKKPNTIVFATGLNQVVLNKNKNSLEMVQSVVEPSDPKWGPIFGEWEIDEENPVYSTNIPSLELLIALEDFYCHNKKYRDLLGGTRPTDYREEYRSFYNSLTDNEKMIFCRALDEVTPLVQPKGFSANIGLNFGIGADAPTAASVNQTVESIMDDAFTAVVCGQGLSFDIMDFLPLPLPTTDLIRPMQLDFESMIREMITNLITSLIRSILEMVKQMLFGFDICGASEDFNPFGLNNPVGIIAKSQVEGSSSATPQSRGRPSTISAAAAIANCFRKNGIKYTDVNTAVNFINDAAALFTISDFRSLVKPQYAQNNNNTKNYRKIINLAKEKYADSFGPQIHSVTDVISLFRCIGSLMNDLVLQDEVDRVKELRDATLSICLDDECRSSIASQLGKYITENDALEQCGQNKKDNLNKIKEILPFLDPSRLPEMMPSLFCEPCQVDKESLLKISEPSSEYLNDKINLAVYESINDVFNNDIDKFKPIMLETEAVLTNFLSTKYTDPKGDDNSTAINFLMRKVFDNEKVDMSVINDIKSLANNRVNGSGGLVVPQLYNSIIETVSGNNVKSWTRLPEEVQTEFEQVGDHYSQLRVQILEYNTDRYNFNLYLNPGEATQISPEALDGPYDLPARTIKLLIYDNYERSLELNYNFPGLDVSNLEEYFAMSCFNEMDKYSSVSNLDAEDFMSFFGTSLSTIFEDILLSTTSSGIFQKEVFGLIAFKDGECPDELNNTILDINGVLKKVSDWAKTLECQIPMTASPSAREVANLMGLYTIILRVFLTEEYFKNIFVFAMYNIKDVAESEAYMNFVYANIVQKLQRFKNCAGISFEDYALSLTTARRDSGEDIPTDATISRQEAVKYLILEQVHWVAHAIDSRIKKATGAFIGLDELKVSTPNANLLYYNIINDISRKTKISTLFPHEVGLHTQLDNVGNNPMGNLVFKQAPLGGYEDLWVEGTAVPDSPQFYFDQRKLSGDDPRPTTTAEAHIQYDPFNGGFIMQEFTYLSSKYATTNGGTLLVDKMVDFLEKGINTQAGHHSWSDGASPLGYEKQGNKIQTPHPFLAELHDYIMTDVATAFLTRPGTEEQGTGMHGLNPNEPGKEWTFGPYAWSHAPLSSEFDADGSMWKERMLPGNPGLSFKYRGKIDMPTGTPLKPFYSGQKSAEPYAGIGVDVGSYYQDRVAKLDSIFENAYDILTSFGAGTGDFIELEAKKQFILDAPYTDWFKPLQHGLRLLLVLPKTNVKPGEPPSTGTALSDMAFNNIIDKFNIDSLNKNDNYIDLLEDKILSYLDNNGNEWLAIPIAEVLQEATDINPNTSVRDFFAHPVWGPGATDWTNVKSSESWSWFKYYEDLKPTGAAPGSDLEKQLIENESVTPPIADSKEPPPLDVYWEDLDPLYPMTISTIASSTPGLPWMAPLRTRAGKEWVKWYFNWLNGPGREAVNTYASDVFDGSPMTLYGGIDPYVWRLYNALSWHASYSETPGFIYDVGFGKLIDALNHGFSYPPPTWTYPALTWPPENAGKRLDEKIGESKAILNEISESLHEKMTDKLMSNEYSGLFQKIIPVQQLMLMTAFYHRITLESLYPELDSLFDSTLQTALNAFVMQDAAINKDYQFNVDLPDMDIFGIDWGALIFGFVKMAVQASATTVDPTWRTFWFAPGPSTPVGFLAKILSEFPDLDLDFLSCLYKDGAMTRSTNPAGTEETCQPSALATAQAMAAQGSTGNLADCLPSLPSFSFPELGFDINGNPIISDSGAECIEKV